MCISGTFKPYNTKTNWLAGCDVKESLHCCACLLFGDSDDRTGVWTRDGFSNLNVISVSISRYGKPLGHTTESLEVSTLVWTQE